MLKVLVLVVCYDKIEGVNWCILWVHKHNSTIIMLVPAGSFS